MTTEEKKLGELKNERAICQKQKGKNIKMEIVEILKQCKVSGNVAILPDIKLDRKTYLEVAKKIELIGGKWDKKNKGFLFPQDPSELLGIIASGEQKNIKKEYQFFATPEALAERLACEIPQDVETALEPSAGQGAIVKAINKLRPDIKVFSCELMELNRKQFVGDSTHLKDDFLMLSPENKFDVVVANPPFAKNQDIEHFYKMVEHATRKIICIMSTHWIHSNNKKEKAFREFLDNNNASVETIPAGAFKESGTSVETCLVILNVTKK